MLVRTVRRGGSRAGLLRSGVDNTRVLHLQNITYWYRYAWRRLKYWNGVLLCCHLQFTKGHGHLIMQHSRPVSSDRSKIRRCGNWYGRHNLQIVSHTYRGPAPLSSENVSRHVLDPRFVSQCTTFDFAAV